MTGITDRSIIVTGGASGIGEAAVRLFADHGALLTVADVNVEKGQALVDELVAQGRTAQFVRTDLASEADVVAMVQAAEAAYGRLDGAFNNAAIPNSGLLLADIPLEQFNRVFAINVTGTFLCMKHEIPALMRAGKGAIVNTASVGSLVYIPRAGEYTASKHAVSGLTKAAAAEYGEHAIRVNAIAPSTTRTPMYLEYVEKNPDYERTVAASHALRRGSEPIEQAQAAMWLLSDAASFVTGTTLLVDGGYTMM